MKLIWIGAAIIFAIAAAATWFSFSRPDFMVGFIAASVAAIYQALSPALLKRNPPEIEEKMKQASRQAQEWDNWLKRPRDKK